MKPSVTSRNRRNLIVCEKHPSRQVSKSEVTSSYYVLCHFGDLTQILKPLGREVTRLKNYATVGVNHTTL